MLNNQYHRKFPGNISIFGNTVVLYGGLSAEREISIKTGNAVLSALLNKGVLAEGIDVGNDVVEKIIEKKPDRVFIALHGPGGEDGKIQAVLDWLNIPYTGSGHLASALAMDKLLTKRVWQNIKIATPDFRTLTNDSDWKAIINELSGDVFVKPVHEGSSIGMSIASSEKDLEKAYRVAAKYDAHVFAEKKITGAEYTTSILNGQVLPTILLKPENTFYDFDAKYISDKTQYICPCGLESSKQEILNRLALNAFESLGCSGWGRVDVMADMNGKFFLLEVNTVPGLTDHSLVPMAAKQVGLTFDDLVLEILMQTV